MPPSFIIFLLSVQLTILLQQSVYCLYGLGVVINHCISSRLTGFYSAGELMMLSTASYHLWFQHHTCYYYCITSWIESWHSVLYKFWGQRTAPCCEFLQSGHLLNHILSIKQKEHSSAHAGAADDSVGFKETWTERKSKKNQCCVG